MLDALIGGVLFCLIGGMIGAVILILSRFGGVEALRMRQAMKASDWVGQLFGAFTLGVIIALLLFGLAQCSTGSHCQRDWDGRSNPLVC